MPTLEEKFTELQGLMAGNHTALLSAIASQQASLDTIAINSGLQSTALALIKLDTGGVNDKLNTIAQLLTTLNAGAIPPLAQIAGAFVGPDGNFPGSSTFFGGVLASMFLNTVGISNSGYATVELLQAIAGSATSTNGWAQSINGEVTGMLPLLEAIRVCSCATTTPIDPTGCDPVVQGVLEVGATISGETGLNPLSSISINVQPGTSGAANGDQVASSAGCFVMFPGATSNHSGAAGNFVELNGFSIFNVFPPRKFAITVETAINSPVIKYFTLNADSGIFQLEANLSPGNPIIINPLDYSSAARFVIVVQGDNQNDATAGTVGLRVCPA